MKGFNCFILFFLFGLVAQTYSQQLALKTYSVEDGLVQSSVYAILQDRDGYLWFGTEGGVSKFDGVKFTNYTVSDGLGQSHVRCIMQDRKGNLWFGTVGGGVSKYDGKKFITYSEKDGFGSNEILSLLEDKDGIIWIGTDGGGVNKFINGKLIPFTDKDGLSNNVVRSIFQDSKGRIWLSSGVAGGGVTCLSEKQVIKYSTKNGLISNVIIAINEDRNGNLWFSSTNGISKFDGNKFFNYNSKDNLPEQPIVAVFVDNKNIIWLGTRGGLVKFDNSQFTTYATENGLSSNSILSIFEDKRGDLWIGTFNGGVQKFPAERLISYTYKDKMPAAVYAINQNSNGDILFGTYGEGIIIKQKNDIFKKMKSSHGLADDFISSIVSDKNGGLWIGTVGGLSHLSNGAFKNYNKNNGLVDNYVNSLIFNSKNELWIGTEDGVSKYAQGKFTNYSTRHGLSSNMIFNIFEDHNGKIWFGTQNGVSIFDEGKFYSINSEILENNSVFHVYENSDSNIILSTQNGLFKYDEKKIILYSVKDQLSTSTCNYSIEADGHLFVGTNNGIIKLDQNSNANDISIIKLSNVETTVQGVFKDEMGNIWFGTVDGVTLFNPNNKAALYYPNIFVKRLMVNNNDTPFLHNIDLSYDQNYLRFDFIMPFFTSPDKVNYYYMLDGIDKDWNITNEHSISYPYLPPGNYIFKVKAKSSDGIWSENVAQIVFIINPPFWTTFWFKGILILLTGASIYFFYIYKTKQVKRRNIELSLMVKERTKELEQEKNKSEELLLNILPDILVNELKENGFVQPREYKNITIMFTDFKGFTYIADVLPADKLVYELNDIYKEFDKIIESNKVEKLKTIGDSYMIGAGLPVETEDHAVRIIKTGLEMQEYISERNKSSAIKWDMRAGVHSGNVIAGVVGTKKFTYDIWGDTVNIASRLESAGEPGQINISAYTYMLVRDYFNCEYRGKVSTKGKGELDMYFVKEQKSVI